MRHDHRPKHAHHDGHRARGQAWGNPRRDGTRPVNLDQGELCQKREAHYAHKGNDPALGTLVGAREQHRSRGRRHDDAAKVQWQAKQHLERNPAAENLGHGRGDGGEVGAAKNDAACEAWQVARRRLGQARAGGDAQVRRVVLQRDQHERRERDDPQQRVAKLRPSRHVRCPVARVDEAYGHEEAGAYVAQDLQTSVRASPLGAEVSFEVVEHGRYLCALP